MDPNASKDLPPDYMYKPISKGETLAAKFYAFGATAIVITGLICLGIYVKFYRKGHLARKAARYEEEVRCQPRVIPSFVIVSDAILLI